MTIKAHFFHKKTAVLSTLFTAVSLLGFSDAAQASFDIAIEPTKVHVPKGFDSNDEVEVVITGELPDTCYRRPNGIARIEGQRVMIDLKANKISGPDVVCIQAIVPYMISVPLGQLGEGYYTVEVNPGRVVEKTSDLYVAKSNSNGIDNFTYANVTNVKKSENKNSIYLEGAHPSSCMEIDRIELIPNDKGDTVAVLPIVKQIDYPCDRMMKPFVYEVPVPRAEEAGTVFHVRRIDGRAVNFEW